MGTYLHLLALELGFFLLMGALGSFPALLLGITAPGVRVVLAPALGLAVACCVCLTCSAVLPGRSAAWLVLAPLTVLSVLLAARRSGIANGRRLALPDRRIMAEALAVLLLVTAAFNAPMARRDTLGPVDYNIADVDYFYLPVTDSLVNNALFSFGWKPSWDVATTIAEDDNVGGSQVAFPALAADASVLFGAHPVDTNAAFLIAVLAIGALAILGAVRFYVERPTAAAPVAALLGAGALFYSLFLESSDASIGAVTLAVPSLVVATAFLRERRRVELGLLAIVLAAMLSFHPAFLAPTVAWAAAVLAVLAVRGLLQRTLSWSAVLASARTSLILAGLIIDASPIGFVRALEFAKYVGTGGPGVGGGIANELSLLTLPAYVFQTRELYALTGLPLRLEPLISGLAPVALIALAAFGVWRFRRAWLAVAAVPATVIVAQVLISGRNCHYCAQRSVLVLGPLAAVLLGLGIAALVSLRSRRWIALASLASVALVALVAHKTIVEARRLVDGSHVVPAGFRSLAQRARTQPGPLYLEGSDAWLASIRDAIMLYISAAEESGRRVQIEDTPPLYRGYINVPPPLSAEASNYASVLTRLGSIKTLRQVVARADGFALEQRTASLDASIASGVAADFEPRDPNGTAWVQGPMTFEISALTNAPSWLLATFAGSAVRSVGVAAPVTASIVRRTPSSMTVCVPVAGTGSTRLARLVLSFPIAAPALKLGIFQIDPFPSETLALTAVAAVSRNCGARGP